ncbi:MAG: hypothetical protein IIB71_03605 [Proteobacteria bacterium]|nr:hypothetical protein [Pseudomonadota bacterium]
MNSTCFLTVFVLFSLVATVFLEVALFPDFLAFVLASEVVLTPGFVLVAAFTFPLDADVFGVFFATTVTVVFTFFVAVDFWEDTFLTFVLDRDLACAFFFTLDFSRAFTLTLPFNFVLAFALVWVFALAFPLTLIFPLALTLALTFMAFVPLIFLAVADLAFALGEVLVLVFAAIFFRFAAIGSSSSLCHKNSGSKSSGVHYQIVSVSPSNNYPE